MTSTATTLNQRNELISKCRHINKFKLMNHKIWLLCGKYLCTELFSWCKCFPTFRRHMWSPHIPQNVEKYRPDLTWMWMDFRLIPWYCKFTVICFLNDCEDMKLVQVKKNVDIYHLCSRTIICNISCIIVEYPTRGHTIQFFLQILQTFSYCFFVDFCSYQVHIISYAHNFNFLCKIKTAFWLQL